MAIAEASAYGGGRLRLINGGLDRKQGSMSMREEERSEHRARWHDRVRQQLSSIGELAENWDGYGSERFSSDTLLFAMEVLTNIYTPSLPAPDVSPMSNEAIMIEWLSGAVELTVVISGPYEIEVLFESDMEHEPIEIHLQQDLSRLYPLVRQVAEGATGRVAA